MTISQSLSGWCRLELTCADVAQFLDHAAKGGIQLQDVCWVNALTVRLLVSRHGCRKVTILANRMGAQVRILSREGVYWRVRSLFMRPFFLTGMFLILLMGVLLPGRICFVTVQGNLQVDSTRILEAASEYGILFGASRRHVRSEQVKNQLIEAIPELQWVGVNTKGCTAVISVREKARPEAVSTETEPCDIVALRDGIILDCSATRGKLLCTSGQAVSQGDVLISGGGSLLNVDTVIGASGEIFAATRRQFRVLTPDFALVRGCDDSRRVKFSLQIGKNLINFFKGSGISGSSCVKMYSKYVLTLPGGFSLPVALIKWTLDSGDIISEPLSENDIRGLLSTFASSYLGEQMIAGQISRKFEVLAQQDGVYQLTGAYACTEMIGRAQKEQIGAYNGKTD